MVETLDKWEKEFEIDIRIMLTGITLFQTDEIFSINIFWGEFSFDLPKSELVFGSFLGAFKVLTAYV